MKQRTRLLSLCFVLLFCISVFAGCGDSSAEDGSTDSDATDTVTDSETEAPSNTVNDTVTDTGNDAEQDEDIIGEVTYIGENDITISICEPDQEIDDYASLDGITLTDTGNTDTVTPDSDAQYKYASSGLLYDTAFDDIELGDMIAVTVNDDGVQEIIILDYTAGDSSANDSADDGTSDIGTIPDTTDTTDLTITDGTDDTGTDSAGESTGTAAG